MSSFRNSGVNLQLITLLLLEKKEDRSTNSIGNEKKLFWGSHNHPHHSEIIVPFSLTLSHPYQVSHSITPDGGARGVIVIVV